MDPTQADAPYRENQDKYPSQGRKHSQQLQGNLDIDHENPTHATNKQSFGVKSFSEYRQQSSVSSQLSDVSSKHSDVTNRHSGLYTHKPGVSSQKSGISTKQFEPIYKQQESERLGSSQSPLRSSNTTFGSGLVQTIADNLNDAVSKGEAVSVRGTVYDNSAGSDLGSGTGGENINSSISYLRKPHHYDKEPEIANVSSEDHRRHETLNPMLFKYFYDGIDESGHVSSHRAEPDTPRMRVCFDPEKEIPLLHNWFRENNHPSRAQVRYTVIL